MVAPKSATQLAAEKRKQAQERSAMNRETQEIRLSTQMLLGVGDDRNDMFGPIKTTTGQNQITQGST
jgi:hypothetical protein